MSPENDNDLNNTPMDDDSEDSEYNPFEDTPFEDTVDDVSLSPEELGRLQALAQAEDIIPPEEQDMPEELQVSNMYDLLPIAIANFRHVQITYTNRHFETKEYVIEPYEIGGNKSHPAGYLWGYDIYADTIKSFFLSNISDIQLLNTTFIPRY